jgi:hypothetical protein
MWAIVTGSPFFLYYPEENFGIWWIHKVSLQKFVLHNLQVNYGQVVQAGEFASKLVPAQTAGNTFASKLVQLARQVIIYQVLL